MSVLATIPGGTAQIVLDALKRFGITNPYFQAGIMATSWKESLFVPKTELSYKNTSAGRIKGIFRFLQNVPDAEIDTLKKNDVQFFDRVYGGKYGNDQPGDGYRYRGRGFNQITFKNYYKVLSKNLGIDFVKFPDELNKIENAAAAMAYYFKDNLRAGAASGIMQEKFGISSQEQVSSLQQGVQLAIQINAGWKTSFNHSTIQEGYVKALKVAPDFLAFIEASKYVAPVVNAVLAPLEVLNPKKKRGRIILLSVGGVVVLASAAIYHHNKRSA